VQNDVSPAFLCTQGDITKRKEEGKNEAGKIKNRVAEKKEKGGNNLSSHVKTEAERVDGGS